MVVSTEPIPYAAPPFPREEYRRRQELVAKQIEVTGLDALLVTANTHQEYMTGYSGSGSYFKPFPLLVVPGHPLTHVVRWYDEDAVRAEGFEDTIVPYAQQADFVPTLTSVLTKNGLDRGRVGMELSAWNLAPADVSGIQAALPQLTIVDATDIVSKAAAVKSDVEIAAMRASMALTDIAVETFYGALGAGRSELEVAWAVEEAVRRAGGHLATAQMTLVFGRRTSVPHGPPTPNQLAPDEPAFAEIGGVAKGYAAGLCRTALLGHNAQVEELFGIAREALLAAIATLRPGARTGDPDRAAREVLGRSTLGVFRHRAGYQSGIDWSDRGNLSLEPGGEDEIQQNMTFHLPIISFVPGEFCVGVSENVLITATGAEILSSTPNILHVI